MTPLSLLAALLMAMLMVAQAYDRPEATKNFADIDTDESGHASHEEVDAHLDRQFKVLTAACPSLWCPPHLCLWHPAMDPRRASPSVAWLRPPAGARRPVARESERCLPIDAERDGRMVGLL
eukprot:COSAG01_NODE_3065_length_6646_cov_13.181610_4_plen_122_part_00